VSYASYRVVEPPQFLPTHRVHTARTTAPDRDRTPRTSLLLRGVRHAYPYDLFQNASRASQFPNFVSRNRLVVVEKENFATRTAALVIPTIADNRLRHESLQRFMLANDSVTVAVEIR